MSTVEASITIKLPDGEDPKEYIRIVDNLISEATGKETHIHVTEMDDVLTTSPIGPR